jgi:hypothetical protein
MNFTIRDLFWTILVFAIATGWFVNRRSLESELDSAFSRARLWEFRAEQLATQWELIGGKVHWGDDGTSEMIAPSTETRDYDEK